MGGSREALVEQLSHSTAVPPPTLTRMALLRCRQAGCAHQPSWGGSLCQVKPVGRPGADSASSPRGGLGAQLGPTPSSGAMGLQ